jgi:hypothetical protein
LKLESEGIRAVKQLGLALKAVAKKNAPHLNNNLRNNDDTDDDPINSNHYQEQEDDYNRNFDLNSSIVDQLQTDNKIYD